MEKIRLIIFDLDGTLFDAYPAIVDSFNYTMKKFKFPQRSAPVIRRAVGHGDENLLRPFVDSGKLKKALSLYRRHHRIALLKGSRMFPRAKGMLLGFKRKGYRLAVASNRPTEFSMILIRKMGLSGVFDFILCADKLNTRKPHPGIIRSILRHFSFKPQQAVYAGDMAIDIQAGKRAKVRTFAVPTGSDSRQALKREKPYRILGRISNLARFLP